MTYDRLAGTLYAGLPIRLRRAAPLLGITLADGIYLTAWPLWALLAPIAVFVFGFSVGGWHWLPHSIGDGGITGYPAVAFMQMLPLLVIAVAVGALSAGLGLLLIAGYAIGDLFISGATYANLLPDSRLGWWLGHVVIAQLISYLVFLLLAVLPTLATRALAASVPGLWVPTGSVKVKLRALVAAALAGLLVYAWTYMAPMAIRPLWLWTHHGLSPVTVPYFTRVVNPLLPLLAVGFTLVRALIESLARDNQAVKYNAAKVAIAYTAEQLRRDRVGRSGWLGAIAGAIIVTLLLAGMITRLWPTGVVVFVAVLALFILHRVVLPRWAGWQAWVRLTEHVPLILRWLVAVIGAYAIGRGVLALMAWQNRAFGTELFAIVLGLVLGVVLFPPLVKPPAGIAPSTPVSAKGLAQILVLIGVGALMLHPGLALAACAESACCFGTNLTASKVIGGFAIFALFFFLSPETLIGLVLESLAAIGELLVEVAAYTIDLVAKRGLAFVEQVGKEIGKDLVKPGNSIAELAEFIYGVGMNTIGGGPALLYRCLSIFMDAGEVGAEGKAAVLAAENDLAVISAKVVEATSMDYIVERVGEKLPEVLKEGADELRKGASAAEDSIRHAVEGITDLTHDPAITPDPLETEGGGQAGAPLPAMGGSGFDPISHADFASLLAPAPDVPAHASVQIGANEGLQSSYTTPFSDVHFGQPGVAGSHYLWTSDGRDVSIAPAHSKVPGTGEPIALTNLATHAASGGQVWFGPDNTVTLQLDASGGFSCTHSHEQVQVIIQLWRSLGYTVNVLPPGI